jgi:hypothetical protein
MRTTERWTIRKQNRTPAIDAAAITVDRAHTAWRNSLIKGLLLLEIQAAIRSLAKGRLVNLMKGRKIDGDLI